MRFGPAWTPAEDEVLRANWYGGYLTAGPLLPHRSMKSVQARAQKLGLRADMKAARSEIPRKRRAPVLVYAQTEHERWLAAFLSAPRAA